MSVKFASRDKDIPLASLIRHEVYGALYSDLNGERRDKFKESLRQQGQQVNIVILKEKDKYAVIDGYQRWQIATELEWKNIKADIVSTGHWITLTDEQRKQFCEDLNEHRRHLTLAEKTETYKSIKKRGRGKPKANSPESGELETSDISAKNDDSVEDAAKSAGFSSSRRAKEAVELIDATIPEVHAAIEAKTITKEQAKQIAKVPKLEQQEALDRAIAGQPIVPPKPEPPKPTTTEEKMKEGNGEIESWCRSIDKVFKESKPENPWLGNDEIAIAESQIKSAVATLRAAKGYGECPKCDGGMQVLPQVRVDASVTLRKQWGAKEMMPLFDPRLKTGAELAASKTGVSLPDPTIMPRDYQISAIDRAFVLWAGGAIGVIIRSPTGSGKTVTGALVAHRWLMQGPEYRVLVIAHERQLVGQFRDELQDILNIRIGTEMAGESVSKSDIASGKVKIIVASRQTLLERNVVDEEGTTVRASRLHKFDLRFKWLVILDEVHRWAYKLSSCRHILQYFDQMPFNRRLGLTATPMRGDKTSLEKVCPEVASDYRLCDVDGGKCAVNDGWAVPYDQRFIVVEGVDFKNIREVAHDFREDDLEAMMLQEGMLAKLCQPMIDLVGSRRTLIFSPGVDCAKQVAHWLNAHVSPECAQSLDGSIPDSIRKQTYKAHQSGKFQFLSVCGLCREGYNDPGIQAVSVFRPTKSRTLAEQMKGRGCRPLRGLVDGLPTPDERRDAIAKSEKPNCMIVDLVGITGLADTASTVKLMAEGKSDEVIERAEENILEEGGDVAAHIRRAEEEIAAEREKIRLAIAERERRAQEEANRRARLRAQVTYTQTQVQQGAGGTVRKVGSNRPMLYGKYKGQQLSSIPLDYLEWIIANHDHIKPWLKASILETIEAKKAQGEKPEPATAKQIGWMRWKGIRFAPGITKKEAIRAITDWKAMNEPEREPGSDD